MRKLLFVLFASLASGISVYAQDVKPSPKPVASTITIAEAKNSKASPAPKPAAKRGPVFRPTKDQIKQVQAMMKQKSLYNGEATGSYNAETRTGIKSFQKDNGLKQTGKLNRVTLEKMGIELTETQKAIPVSESSDTSTEAKTAKPAKSSTSATMATTTSPEAKPKKVIFRATKEQIMAAQKILKTGGMYGGEETGTLDDPTRGGLKKYQAANGLTVTGRLNAALLEKMGIALTEKQKADAEAIK